MLRGDSIGREPFEVDTGGRLLIRGSKEGRVVDIGGFRGFLEHLIAGVQRLKFDVEGSTVFEGEMQH